MDSQQNSPDNLRTKSQQQTARPASPGKGQTSAKTEDDHERGSMVSSVRNRSGLVRFALKLATLPHNEVLTFILSEAHSIFGAKAALYSVYIDEIPGLQVVSASVSETGSLSEHQMIEEKFLNLGIPLNKNQVDHICSAPFHFYSDLTNVSPDRIPPAYVILSESISDPEWLLEMSFCYKQKLAGVILMVGSKNQGLPEPEDIYYFCSISSNAIARKLAEEKAEAIADYTANWESWFDNNGKIIWTNPASLKFTGYSPAEIIAFPDYIETLVAESDRQRITDTLHEALGGKDDSWAEFECVRKDQSRFKILVSWKHIYDKEGKALGIRASGQDITTYRKAADDFTHTESLYRQMIDNAPFGMHFYQLNDEGRLVFTSANHAAGVILGIDHNQLIGMTIEEAFPSLKDTGVIEHYSNAARNNVTWVTDQIFYSDNKITGAFEVKAFQTVPGRMVAIFSDITNRKKAEEALRESRQLFETLTRVSPVGIFRTNSDGATTFVNPKWTALTGLSFRDAMGYKYLAAIHPDDREERVREWNAAVKKGKSVVSEYRFFRSDGSIIWVQGRAVPEIVDGKIKGYIGTITDISELKKAGEELLQAKEKAEASNRLKTTFMGNISHEIRTPLNGIIGFADLISSGNNTPEENKECIEFLNHSINRLTKIIDNIMDLSMMMSGNTVVNHETFRVDLLISEIVKQYESAAIRKNIGFTIEGFDQMTGKSIISDEILIRRVFNELLDNAIKFTKKGEVIVWCRLIHNELTIQLKDTGIGISQQMLPFILEPFVQENVYTTRMSNSNGLGLSIVNEAVNLLKGSLVIESTLGSGTNVLINLPVIESANKTEIEFYPPEPEKKEIHPVILIVEDEEINMIYLKRILNLKGYKLLLASNGPEAISFIEQGSHVDLILMDIRMPGMDGFEATRRIKAINPDIRITAVTAYASDADRQQCLEAGCDNYISKPFQKNDLYQLLGKML
jgi:PAS domain S-box-containing protein